jgi:hypothetical protein
VRALLARAQVQHSMHLPHQQAGHQYANHAHCSGGLLSVLKHDN